jgi:hypothetical protein
MRKVCKFKPKNRGFAVSSLDLARLPSSDARARMYFSEIENFRIFLIDYMPSSWLASQVCTYSGKARLDSYIQQTLIEC